MGFKVKPANWKLKASGRITCPLCSWSQDASLFYLKIRMKKGDYLKCPKCQQIIGRNWIIRKLPSTRR